MLSRNQEMAEGGATVSPGYWPMSSLGPAGPCWCVPWPVCPALDFGYCGTPPVPLACTLFGFCSRDWTQGC